MITENEIPKYLKSTESNISKSNRKSKHKHHYEECLIQYKNDFIKKTIVTKLSSYCTVCGKIGRRFDEDKTIVKDYKREIDSPFPRYKCTSIITGDELYERYRDKMPVFFVDDIYKEKYVDLEQNCNSEGE